MKDVWKTIVMSDFVKKLPKFLSPTIYEINELGEIRKFSPLSRTLRYIPVIVDEFDGKKYVTITVGWAYCTVIRKTLPIEIIIGKYFQKKS